MKEVVNYIYLSRQSDRKTYIMAVGTERPGGGGRGTSSLCPGAGRPGFPAAAGTDGALRFPQYPYGGFQYSGLPAQRGLLSLFTSATLRMEGSS